MKRNSFLLVSLMIGITSLYSCKKEAAHKDFIYTSGYFPYQFPVRTIILGDYIFDNSNDNDHKFVISTHIGGVYENDKDREFEIEIDKSLSNNILFNSNGDTVYAMPDNYFKLMSDKIIIPKGKMSGGVEVQLTDAFFEDTLAIKLNYIVPIRIKGSTDVDTILVGQSDKPNADPRIASDWTVPPKDFTMFAVKYINEYHGTYFYSGKSQVKDISGAVVEDTTYNNEDIVKNPATKLITTGRHQVSFNTFLSSKILNEEVKMLLTFNGNNCVVTQAEGSVYTVSGTGEFKSKEYVWGDKKRDGIVLTYTVSDCENTATVNDVLVSRDRGVVLETYSPVSY